MADRFPRILVVYTTLMGEAPRAARRLAEGVLTRPGLTVAVSAIEDTSRAELLAADGIALVVAKHVGGVDWWFGRFLERTLGDLAAEGRLEGKIMGALVLGTRHGPPDDELARVVRATLAAAGAVLVTDVDDPAAPGRSGTPERFDAIATGFGAAMARATGHKGRLDTLRCARRENATLAGDSQG
jgi:multimeric flavodoxin WrbA